MGVPILDHGCFRGIHVGDDDPAKFSWRAATMAMKSALSALCVAPSHLAASLSVFQHFSWS